MKQEEIAILAHLLTAMKDVLKSLDEAQRKKDLEKLTSAKKEMLALQSQVDKILTQR